MLSAFKMSFIAHCVGYSHCPCNFPLAKSSFKERRDRPFADRVWWVEAVAGWPALDQHLPSCVARAWATLLLLTVGDAGLREGFAQTPAVARSVQSEDRAPSEEGSARRGLPFSLSICV